MSDHLDRAAQFVVVERGTADKSLHDEMCDVCEEGCCCSCVVDRVGLAALKALDEAGMLASPERDAGVAVRALRGAAEALDDMQTPDNDEHRRVLLDPALWLTERADRIEREVGESGG